MSHAKKICVEGLPRVGKSTIIEPYKQEYNCIPEFFNYIDLDIFSDKVENLNDLRANQQKFIEIEKLRKSQIKKETNIIDRCVLSNLAFSYAFSKIKKDDGYFIESVKLHYDSLKKSKIILPTHYIFIESADNVDIKNKLSKIKPSLTTNWSKELFMNKIREFYNLYFTNYCMVPKISFNRFPKREEVDKVLKKFAQQDSIKEDEGIKELMEDYL